MGTPQIVFIVMLVIAGVLTLVKHGENKGNHNIFVWGLATMIEVGILYWGGFF